MDDKKRKLGLGNVVAFVCCVLRRLVRIGAWLTKDRLKSNPEKSIDVAGHRWREARHRPRRDQLAGLHTTCRHLIIVCISVITKSAIHVNS